MHAATFGFLSVEMQCHMQVLLSREAGDNVSREWKEGRDAVPWPLLFDISQYYFVEPEKHMSAFKESLVKNSDNLPDVVLFPISVSTSREHSRIVASPDSIIYSFICIEISI